MFQLSKCRPSGVLERPAVQVHKVIFGVCVLLSRRKEGKLSKRLLKRPYTTQGTYFYGHFFSGCITYDTCGLRRISCLDIGALQRRCRPQVTRIGIYGALHSRRAIPRWFNRSLTSSRYFRLPSTEPVNAPGLENVILLGYNFAVLWD